MKKRGMHAYTCVQQRLVPSRPDLHKVHASPIVTSVYVVVYSAYTCLQQRLAPSRPDLHDVQGPITSVNEVMSNPGKLHDVLMGRFAVGAENPSDIQRIAAAAVEDGAGCGGSLFFD